MKENTIMKTNKKDKVISFVKSIFGEPLYLMSHPIRGFDEFKREQTGKNSIAIFYLIMMCLVSVIAYNGTGFIVNRNIPKDFNVLLIISLIIVPVILGTVGNWSITALFDGKGHLADIFRVICYSFFPFVWITLFNIILSNFITVDEVMFYQFFNGLAVFLLVYMLFFGLMGIHEYGLLKNILMILFTIVAIGAILFIILLFLTLIQHVLGFLGSVYAEFARRFFMVVTR